MEKSTPVIERLKAGKVPKFTVCGKQFKTFMTLSVKTSVADTTTERLE